jgi:hypothetical protein
MPIEWLYECSEFCGFYFVLSISANFVWMAMADPGAPLSRYVPKILLITTLVMFLGLVLALGGLEIAAAYQKIH